MDAAELLSHRQWDFFVAAEAECRRAATKHAPIHSLHEGYAVLLEEVDELWDKVRKKERDRDPREVLAELHQIAAMAARIATDVIMPTIEAAKNPQPPIGNPQSHE